MRIEGPNLPQREVPEHTYEVKQGDTLHSIASQLGVSQEDLVRHNRLSKGAELRPGLQLLIPPGKGGDESPQGISGLADRLEAFRPDTGWRDQQLDSAGIASPGEQVEGKFLGGSEQVEHKITSPGEQVEGKFLGLSEQLEHKITSPGEQVEGKFLGGSEQVEHKLISPGEQVEGKFLSPSEQVEHKITVQLDQSDLKLKKSE